MSNAAPRFKQVRELLELTQGQLAQALGVSRNYVTLIETGAKEPSNRLVTSLESLRLSQAHKGSIRHRLDSGVKNSQFVEEERGKYGKVASRIPQQRSPSTRQDCEAYMVQLLDAADLSENPNAFPVIHDRMKKEFPLDEWGLVEKNKP